MLKTLQNPVIIYLSIKAYSNTILKYYIASFFSINKFKNIKVSFQPIIKKNLTVLKSPHKYKKAQNHFQLKMYKGLLIIQTINIFELLFLLINKPQGVLINLKVKQIKKI